MCFQTTFGNGVICPLFNGLNFELCLFISMLAGHKFVLAEMCRFYTFGYELNFQPTQLEAFIQAFSNKPLRLHKGKGSAYHQPLSTLRYIDRRRVCFLATLCAADRLVLYTAILKGSKNPFKTTSSFLSRSTIVIMTIV